MTDIAGKNVLITGGAQGIGFEMAKRVADRGARLIITDINKDALAQATTRLPGSIGHLMDVTKEGQITAVKKNIHDQVGTIDILINNAGVVFGGEFTKTPMTQHRLTYDVNTIGLVAVSHAFMPDLIASSGAHFVTIGSASGMIGLPYGSSYASSKWAAIGFTDSLRLEMKELGHSHIKFTIVNPSYIKTGMFGGVAQPRMLPLLTPEGIADKIIKGIESNKLMVHEPALVKVLPFLKGVLPTNLRDRVLWNLGVTSSMKKWKGHDASKINEKKSA